ncbi:MAG: ABC transporter permease subunit, partial [Propionibacteriaceae bacterium]|nr:ABC transporter permease subunit [Propionibacteriaceae bacterium]
MKRSPAVTGTYYILTTALALAFLAPLLWAVISSVSPAPGTSQLQGYGFNNYRTLFEYGLGLPSYLWHSVVISAIVVVVTVVVAATGGYAFARYSFRGRNVLFIAVLAIMMVPYAALLIPMVVWTKQLGLQNSLVGTGLVLTLFQLPFGVLIMRNAFAAIPRELRYSFRGRGALFIAVLAIMMVPYAALLIPMVVWTKQLGLQNSLVGTGLVLTLFQLPFGVLIMRNAFAAIPRELEEAAAIDGCGALGAFRRVMLPAVVPSVVTVGLFAYLAAWNDFMVSLYLLSMGNAPLPLALVNMRQQ